MIEVYASDQVGPERHGRWRKWYQAWTDGQSQLSDTTGMSWTASLLEKQPQHLQEIRRPMFILLGKLRKVSTSPFREEVYSSMPAFRVETTGFHFYL